MNSWQCYHLVYHGPIGYKFSNLTIVGHVLSWPVTWSFLWPRGPGPPARPLRCMSGCLLARVRGIWQEVVRLVVVREEQRLFFHEKLLVLFFAALTFSLFAEKRRFNLSVSQSIHQSSNQPIDQSINQTLINRSIDQTHWFHHSINQWTNNQSIWKSIKWSINQSINQSVYQEMNQCWMTNYTGSFDLVVQ